MIGYINSRDVMDSDHSMMAEIRSAGLDLASVEELKSQLKQYSGGTFSIKIIHFIHLVLNTQL